MRSVPMVANHRMAWRRFYEPPHLWEIRYKRDAVRMIKLPFAIAGVKIEIVD